MRNPAEKLLKSLVGEDGLESLQKAIFRSQTRSVADPLELYLPLLVVPRAILSWLVQNIQPMKVGEIKELRFPAQPDALMNVEKQTSDVYRGEIVRRGNVIHTFDKQSLPAIGGHLMTVFEQYGHLNDPSTQGSLIPGQNTVQNANDMSTVDNKLSEMITHGASRKPVLADSSEVVRTIMDLNGVKMESSDSGAIEKVMQYAQMKSLTESIGKLVDALVDKKIKKEEMEKQEMSSEPKKSKLPETNPKETRIKTLQEGKPPLLVAHESDNPKNSHVKPKPELMQEGEEAGDAEPESYPTPHIPENVKKDEFSSRNAKYKDIKRKLAHDDMMRNWKKRGFNPREAAKQAVHNASIHPAPKKENLGKAGIMKPSGAAISSPPTVPKSPISSALKPAAQKQSQVAAMGGQTKPSPGSTNKPINGSPTKIKETPKMSAIKSELQAKAGSATHRGGAGGGSHKSYHWKTPGGQVPRTSFPAGTSDKMRALDMQTGKYRMHGPKTDLPKSEELMKPRGLRDLIRKSETHHVFDDEVYTPCEQCGQPEFVSSPSGPKFNPCACFQVLTKDENGNPANFVALKKKEGGYELDFNPGADPDVVKTFLLTLKTRLLLRKRFGV